MFADLTDEELVNALRRCAGIWFKNSDLLLLEELIRRFTGREHRPPASPDDPPRVLTKDDPTGWA